MTILGDTTSIAVVAILAGVRRDFLVTAIEPKGSRLLLSGPPIRDPEETMRILAGTVLALFLAAGPAGAEDWKEYSYPDHGVAIQFPAKPEAVKSTYDSIYVKGLASL